MHRKISIFICLWMLGLVGLCGLHRIYVGRTFSGIIWLFTLGLFGFGQIIDLFISPSLVGFSSEEEDSFSENSAKSSFPLVGSSTYVHTINYNSAPRKKKCSYCGASE